MCVKLTIFRWVVGSQHCRRHEDCSLGAPNLQPSAPLSFLLIYFYLFLISFDLQKYILQFGKNAFGQSHSGCLFFLLYFCNFLISNNLSVTSFFLIENMESYECIITSAVPPPTKFVPKKPTRISLLCSASKQIKFLKSCLPKITREQYFLWKHFCPKAQLRLSCGRFLRGQPIMSSKITLCGRGKQLPTY